MFKVGDRVRRVRHASPWANIGFESIVRPNGTIMGEDSQEMYILPEHWVVLPDSAVGPVVTETVTKTRIVPGVYDGVSVRDSYVSFMIPDYSADELDAAAAVLSALAKGLRDAG